MPRIAKLSPRFLNRLRAAGAVNGSPLSRQVGRTVQALTVAATLPGLEDVEGALPPTGRAWVRRVPGENLWIWYRVGDGLVSLVTLSTTPPVPID